MRNHGHMRSVYLLLFLYTILNTMTATAQNTDFEESWDIIQNSFEEKLTKKKIAGGALLFLEKGDVKGSSFYGLADINNNRKVDENTIFHWASITKTFTAIAIMQLRDQGLLSLDDPITKFLPELKKIHNPFGSLDDVTIRMALEHSTGLRNPTWPWGGDKEWHPFEPTEWNQLVAMFPYTKIEFEPGSQYSYSNPAIIFLGRIIEILSGDPYETVIYKNILKPLKMHNTYFNTTPAHLLPDRSNSYKVKNEEYQERGFDFHTGITTSNGGLNAPLKDMINYINFLTGEPTSYPILERSSLEEMWEISHLIEDQNNMRSSVGLSFFIEELNDMRLIGHTGTQHSFYSFFYIHPESRTAVISVTNTDGDPDMFQFRNEMSRAVFDSLFVLFKN